MINAPASFSIDKLLWFNKKYISNLDNRSLISKASGYSNHFKEDSKSIVVINLIKDRCSLMSDFKKESDYFFEDLDKIDSKLSSKVFNKQALEILKTLIEELEKVSEWTAEKIHSSIENVMSKNKVDMGSVGNPFILSITGQMNSPSIDKTAVILGKEKVIRRMNQVIKEFS